jgi:hypothetical protein
MVAFIQPPRNSPPLSISDFKESAMSISYQDALAQLEILTANGRVPLSKSQSSIARDDLLKIGSSYSNRANWTECDEESISAH